MKMSPKIVAVLLLCFSCPLIFPVTLPALTVDEIIKLKQAGVEDRTIQMLIEREKMKREGPGGVGVEVTIRPDGGREVNYFSVTTPEEERKARLEEEEKMERALEILRNVIIDDRGHIDDRRR